MALPLMYINRSQCVHCSDASKRDEVYIVESMGESGVLHSDPTPTFSHTSPFVYTRLLILGTALPSSLTTPIPFLLTLLISSLALPLNHFVSSSCYALGYILVTTSLSSAPIALMGTLQSFGSWPGPIRLMLIS